MSLPLLVWPGVPRAACLPVPSPALADQPLVAPTPALVNADETEVP